MAPKHKTTKRGGKRQEEKKKKKTGDAPVRERHTRSMTADASMAAVLSTGELLENILIHLPAKDIFVLQRVSKSFQDTIHRSLGIQRKLFLRLEDHSEELDNPITGQLNPIFDLVDTAEDEQQSLVSFKFDISSRLERVNASVLEAYISDPPPQSIRVAVKWEVSSPAGSQIRIDGSFGMRATGSTITVDHVVHGVYSRVASFRWSDQRGRHYSQIGGLKSLFNKLAADGYTQVKFLQEESSLQLGGIVVATDEEMSSQ